MGVTNVAPTLIIISGPAGGPSGKLEDMRNALQRNPSLCSEISMTAWGCKTYQCADVKTMHILGEPYY